ncbi:hypothetical protein CC80DRAFT_507138 [Byssothecium circinans]|uniref:polynucleotide adenylyltransferase n=1 Tax=Byssothecium circinans TaxID=147558 RepID=A0A6A5TXH5_9PLEO|nr:hypothetical protein CC80DRAFT_507138 [Byssothecium circinans]
MADSHRSKRRPRDQRARPPPVSLADRVTFSGGNQNDSSGRTAGSEQFTFTSDNRAPRFPPSGPADAQARARGGRRKPNRGGAMNRNNDRDHDRNRDRDRRAGDSASDPAGGRNAASAPGRGNFHNSNNFRRQAPHERALLQSRDDRVDESFVKLGSNKFNLDNLDHQSDQSSSMDLGTDDSDSDDGAAGGRAKVARTQSNGQADGNSVPKWSNPDPYTALPPPQIGKRVDVVGLIRKAKNDITEKTNGTNAVAANHDFISFDQEDVVAAPLNQIPAPAAMAVAPTALHGNAGPSRNKQGRKRAREEYDASDIDLVSETIVKHWRPPRTGSTPWATGGRYSHFKHDPLKWLRNEMYDFYESMTPTPHESGVRLNLLYRIRDVLRYFKLQPGVSTTVESFGSFPSGLYLPAADMDLVYISTNLYTANTPVLQRPSFTKLKKMGDHLQDRGLAGAVTVISKAKVPIIKFVDRYTGIPVDISVENRSGLDAQFYFAQWKRDYPDMMLLVALVKQFLLMRDLNEVNTGGLGGFSIICLAVNFMQRSPKTEDVGQLFLDFLDFYGNKFDMRKERLIMRHPYIVQKEALGLDGKPEKLDRLSIQDPNRPENNISGGSSEIATIFKLFRGARALILQRMDEIRNGTYSGNSILETILDGNYQIYHDFRWKLTTCRASY